MAYLYLALAIVAEVIGTSALKASEQFTRLGPTIITAIGYGAAFWLLSLSLRQIPVGVAYAMWSGLGVVLIASVGVVLYGEKLDLAAIVGFALIIAGCLVLNLVSRSGGH
ncbi:multidrug efflux SMR transporter [Pseudoxanthobacter sp.]|uniref:DMT family transporter n=1 Tax=Pseudoxanthobacter sp. TaxID=1925742 RepID=UPI002FE403E8